MGVRVKEMESDSNRLEEDINNWLSCNKEKTILDIKYSVSRVYGAKKLKSALIIYKE